MLNLKWEAAEESKYPEKIRLKRTTSLQMIFQGVVDCFLIKYKGDTLMFYASKFVP